MPEADTVPPAYRTVVTAPNGTVPVLWTVLYWTFVAMSQLHYCTERYPPRLLEIHIFSHSFNLAPPSHTAQCYCPVLSCPVLPFLINRRCPALPAFRPRIYGNNPTSPLPPHSHHVLLCRTDEYSIRLLLSIRPFSTIQGTLFSPTFSTTYPKASYSPSIPPSILHNTSPQLLWRSHTLRPPPVPVPHTTNPNLHLASTTLRQPASTSVTFITSCTVFLYGPPPTYSTPLHSALRIVQTSPPLRKHTRTQKYFIHLALSRGRIAPQPLINFPGTVQSHFPCTPCSDRETLLRRGRYSARGTAQLALYCTVL